MMRNAQLIVGVVAAVCFTADVVERMIRTWND